MSNFLVTLSLHFLLQKHAAEIVLISKPPSPGAVPWCGREACVPLQPPELCHPDWSAGEGPDKAVPWSSRLGVTVPGKCKLTVPRNSNDSTQSSKLKICEYRGSSRELGVSSRELQVSS